MRGQLARLLTNVTWLIVFAVGITLAAFLSFVSGVLFDDSYQITVPMPEAGGVLPAQEVTVLGSAVGQVHDVEVTEEGVLITLKVQGDEQVPLDARIQVLRRSPIGEQSVDFQPLDVPWEPAEPGDRIVPAEAVVPAEVPFLLERARALFAAVDLGDLGIVVHELGVALRGRGERLRELNRDSLDLNRTLVAGIPTFERAIDTSEAVLRTLREHRDALAQSFANAAELGDVLGDSRRDLETIIDNGQRALTQADALIRNERDNISCILDDFRDINDMLLGPSTADGAPAALYDSKLDELEQGFGRARFFFLGFDIGNQFDPTTGIGWARIKFEGPDKPQGGLPYETLRPTPATRPGAACQSPFGTGVNAVGAPGRPQDRTITSSYQAPDPTAPAIEWAPVVEEEAGGTIAPPAPRGRGGAPLPATGGAVAVLAPLAIAGAAALRSRAR